MCVARLNQTPLIEQLQQEKNEIKSAFIRFGVWFSSIFAVFPKETQGPKTEFN